MPNKCVAVGCKSGYVSSLQSKGITFHSFPLLKKELLEKWVRRISRVGWNPTKYSKLCSLHFMDGDFETERSDSDIKYC